MEILEITSNKREYLPLLRLGDEQEELINGYLYRGTLFALYDGGRLRTAAVVTDEGGGVYELQNLATVPKSQRQGYGKAMVAHIVQYCRPRAKRLILGTGDSPLTLPFYAACGFQETHRVRDYFLTHYDHPIFEAGRQLTDKVYLSRTL